GGFDPNVYALAVSGDNVYAGGGFTTAGGNEVSGIAKWNGSSWSALGAGMGGGVGLPAAVDALAVSGGDVSAGGGFASASGSVANNSGEWGGSSWAAVGSGMNGDVRSLAVSGSEVYAGGYFTSAGGSAANNIAKWDGSSWTAL